MIDGQSSHYRDCTILDLVDHHTELSATWQFFECGHSKRDGVGGSAKRSADNGAKRSYKIICSEEFFTIAQTAESVIHHVWGHKPCSRWCRRVGEGCLLGSRLSPLNHDESKQAASRPAGKHHVSKSYMKGGNQSVPICQRWSSVASTLPPVIYRSSSSIRIVL